MDVGVMVLAAGRGSRLEPLSGAVPKPLMRLGGRSLLEWNLTWVAEAGLRRVWINVHHRGEAIEAALGSGARLGVEIRYSREPELLGTAGGWRAVAGEHPGPWLVLYGDNAMRFDLRRFVTAHEAGGAAATIALFDPRRHANTGAAGGRVALAADGRVSRFVEGAPAGAGLTLVNAGAYVLEAEVAAAIGPGYSDFGRDVLPALAARGRVRGHVMEAGGFCLGVDTPARFAVAERLLSAAEVVP